MSSIAGPVEEAIPDYPYSPLALPHPDPEIRLLQIAPKASTSEDNQIHCSLKHVRLREKPRHSALSYCWQDDASSPTNTLNTSNTSSTTGIIICDGFPLAVTKNLHAALFQLRDHKDPDLRTIWIDAMCINQKDTEERSHQVQLMSAIYSGASKFIIWLGVYHESLVPSAMEVINHLAFQPPSNPSTMTYAEKKRYSKTFDQFGIAKFDLLDSVAEILDRPWFYRAWIVQELCLARDAIVMLDGVEMLWSTLYAALRTLKRSGLASPKDSKFLPRDYALELFHFNHSFEDNKERPLLHQLIKFRSCLAGDPRDKVYSFYGISTDTKALGLVPDYDLSTVQVYTQVATSLLLTYENLEFVSIPRPDPAEGLDGLPSWVPDWSNSVPFCDPLGMNIINKAWQCNLHASATTTASFLISNDKKLLGIEGMKIGSVSKLATAHQVTSYVDDPDFVHIFTKLWDEWEQFADTNINKANYNVYLEVITAGHLPEGIDLMKGYFQTIRKIRGSQRIADKIPSSHSYNLVRILRGDWKDHARITEGLGRVRVRPSFGRRLGMASDGKLALLPANSQIGDNIFLVKGSRVPLVLRKEDSGENWTLVGDSYVHGVMQGEAFDESKCQQIWLA